MSWYFMTKSAYGTREVHKDGCWRIGMGYTEYLGNYASHDLAIRKAERMRLKVSLCRYCLQGEINSDLGYHPEKKRGECESAPNHLGNTP